MLNPIFVLTTTQILFTISDVVGRYFMSKYGFTFNNFFSLWFIGYILIRTVATFGQLYVFTQFGLGKTMALYAAISLIVSTGIAFVFLNEMITTSQYIGIILVILAFIILVFSK